MTDLKTIWPARGDATPCDISTINRNCFSHEATQYEYLGAALPVHAGLYAYWLRHIPRFATFHVLSAKSEPDEVTFC